MLVQVKSLEGVALDWAVAKCECLGNGTSSDGLLNDEKVIMKMVDFDNYDNGRYLFSPSTNWSHAGPIISRLKIELLHNPCNGDAAAWYVPKWVVAGTLDFDPYASGPTPLVAAMRYFVSRTFGDSIEIPDEVLKADNHRRSAP